MNYLVLRGLKLHYSDNTEAIKIYNSLRSNIMNLVCNNWEKENYFFENYSDQG